MVCHHTDKSVGKQTMMTFWCVLKDISANFTSLLKKTRTHTNLMKCEVHHSQSEHSK